VSEVNIRLYPKKMRRELHELNKHPKQRVMQLSEVKRPQYVTQTNGLRVKYEGP
jgi:hypothetical protein